MLRRFAAALSSSDDENDDVDAFLEDADRLERQSLIVEQEREDDSEALLLNASSLGMMDGGRNPQDDSVESSGREEDEQERGNGNSSSRSLSFPSSPSDMSPLRHLVEVPLDSTTSSILTDTARGRFLRSRPSSKDGAEAMLILQQQQQQQQQPLFSASRNLPQQHVLLSSSELPLQPLQQTRSQSCARTRSSPPARHASANSENSTSSSVNNKHSTLLSSLLLSTSSSSSSTRCGVHCMAMVMLWIAVVSLVVAIIWYSYELFNHG